MGLSADFRKLRFASDCPIQCRVTWDGYAGVNLPRIEPIIGRIEPGFRGRYLYQFLPCDTHLSVDAL